ncbi:MAG: hypothetical protein HDT23_05190, partial [Ruminococcus sp.]|nr:hypothetical protein [Ruminococcus sp.]
MPIKFSGGGKKDKSKNMLSVMKSFGINSKIFLKNILKQQKILSKNFSSLDKETNKMLVRLQQNAIEQSELIEKMTSEIIISADTIETQWNANMTSVSEVRKIQENAHKKRENEQARLQTVRNSFNSFYAMPNPKKIKEVFIMPINLSKGQKIDLTKTNPGLKNIMVGLGWDVNVFDSGANFDLDASAFLAGADGKCQKDTDFIFYGNLKHSSGAVEHMGDNLTGEGEGDDEQIKINLSLIPANIEKIAFTVTIYDADVRRQNFGQVSNAFIRIVNMDTDEELIRYDLGEDFSIETAVVVGELYKHN